MALIFDEAELRAAIGPRPELMTRERVLQVFKAMGDGIDRIEARISERLELSGEQVVALRQLMNERRQTLVDDIYTAFCDDSDSQR